MYSRNRKMSALLCAGALATLALSCSNHHSGASSLNTPTNSVVGNWVVDGTSILVVSDTGATHDVVNGDVFRIGPNGMEVLLGIHMQPGGVYDRFLNALGAKYEVRDNVALGLEFNTSLRVDTSAARGAPLGTHELVFECSGMFVNSKLEVSYLNRMLLNGNELERDELTFICMPGPLVTADVTGTYDLSDVRVIADPGPPHPFQFGDQTVVQGARVQRLLGFDFTPAAMLGPNANDFQITENYTQAVLGTAEALFMATGKSGTPSAGNRVYNVFSAIRRGDALVGHVFTVHDDGNTEDINALEVAMTMRTRQAVLLGHAPGRQPGKKLLTFVTMLGGY
jgi:hypothetical protein